MLLKILNNGTLYTIKFIKYNFNYEIDFLFKGKWKESHYLTN